MRNQKPVQKIFLRISILCLLILTLPACAAVLAPRNGDAPDISKVAVGATRVQIEQELGEPRTELRTTAKAGGYQKCLYINYLREPEQADASFTDKVIDKFAGFKEQRVTVYYDGWERARRVLFEQEQE